jgi:ElaB/YqjD/DUF883 family membrane-anchored ribosome-binding protein
MSAERQDEAEATETRSPEEIRQDIESTREELGDTVEVLTNKADVKAQASKSADEAKQRARAKAAETKSKLTAAKDDLVGRARETSPETARSATTQAASKARDNPLPMAVAAAALGGFLLGRWTKG